MMLIADVDLENLWITLDKSNYTERRFEDNRQKLEEENRPVSYLPEVNYESMRMRAYVIMRFEALTQRTVIELTCENN